jgi:uncharacterized protein
MKRDGWKWIVWALPIVGAINWGLIGIFNWNLVDAIFGGGVVEETSSASRIVYSLVGLAGLATLALLPRERETRHTGAITGGDRATVRP